MQTPTAVNSNQTARSAPYAVFDFALSTCRWEASAYEVTHRIPTKSAQHAPTKPTQRAGPLEIARMIACSVKVTRRVLSGRPPSAEFTALLERRQICPL